MVRPLFFVNIQYLKILFFSVVNNPLKNTDINDIRGILSNNKKLKLGLRGFNTDWPTIFSHCLDASNPGQLSEPIKCLTLSAKINM